MLNIPRNQIVDLPDFLIEYARFCGVQIGRYEG
jgi:hypothetical protein